MRWINELIERHGEGGWTLFVDADERFIYPGFETTPIRRLVDYLEDEGAEAVGGFMLDVFPEKLFDADGAPTPMTEYRYFDADYAWRNQPAPPYRRPFGGVRARLFQGQETLQKVPLTKAGCGTYLNNHETTHLQFSGVTGALLHYKLFATARAWAAPGRDGAGLFGDDRNPDTMRRYEGYAARLNALSGIDLRAPRVSARLGDSLELCEQGAMLAPPDFRRWLERSRGVRRRPSGTKLAKRRTE